MKILKLLLVLVAFFSFNELSAQCLSGNCVDGIGKFKYPSGGIYQGEFSNGEIHGIGKLIYPDGRVYIGEWVHRYQEGKGKMTMADGRVFKGFWKQGEFYGDDINGEPITLDQNADVIKQSPEIQTGCIEGDCENGKGTMLYADKSKYEGNFKNGKINGYGTFFYADGSKYVGEWKNGYYNGEGTKYNNSTGVRKGLWQNGEYLGTKEDQSKKGCIAGDCYNGEGTYVYGDGSKYIGSFKNGAIEGEGTCYYTDGNKYTGGWKNNTFHGFGIMYFVNGETVEGNWDNGNYLGKNYENVEVVTPTAPKVKYDPTMKIYAIVVGVAKYEKMPVLNYTDDDAYLMYGHLKSPEGGALPNDQVIVLVDEMATKENIVTKMKEMFAKADSNDMVMLYFSGHGLPGAFLPIDFDGFNNQLFHKEVKAIFNNSQAKFKLCIADACHSGGLNYASKGTFDKNSIVSSYYKAFEQVSGSTALLLSSKAEESSLEFNGLRQGVFSHFLMRGMAGEADADYNNIVTIKELFNYINNNVPARTGYKQTPVLNGNYDDRMPISVVR